MTEPEEPKDVDAAFAEIIAGWNVDTTQVIKQAEYDLTQENPQWRAELQPPTEVYSEEDPDYWPSEHYEPPPPPPFPRLHPRTVLAVCLLAAGITFIVLGTAVGFAFSFSLALGVLGVISATVLLLTRLRPTNDEGDDHAHV